MFAGIIAVAKRLRRDTAGNLLAIGAVSVILIMSLIGSGVDISRAYLAKTSLQSACDSGVLAGRRAMDRSGVYETAEKAKANKMFNFNLNAGAVGAEAVVYNTQSTAKGEVTGTASANVPTIVMNVFGYPRFSLSVACSAELQLSSADVMFVLDTTGSMNCLPSDSESTYCPSEVTNAKIKGLRSAVKDFYKTVAGAVQNDDTRIRFGFVPYSMSVNVKPLVTSGVIKPEYLTDVTPYQTRLAYFSPTNVQHNPIPGSPVPTTETYAAAKITQANCNNYGINKYPSTSGLNPVAAGGPAPTATTSTAYSYRSWTLTSGSGTSALGTCVRNKTVTTTTYATVYKLSGFRYIKSNLNTSTFKGTGSITLATGLTSSSTVPTAGYYNLQSLASTSGTSGITTTSYTWSGCIEERSTVVDLDMDPVPSEATDLDINSPPTSDNLTKWKPFFAAPVYLRGNNAVSVDTTTSPSSSYTQQAESGFFNGCPSAVRAFETVDTTDPLTVPTWLDTYLNTLIGKGFTYHDVGMIWGGRIASPRGINQVNVNDEDLPSVSRHIIYMTDGAMKPQTTYYSAYGLEQYDNRVAPSGTDDTELIAYHNSRFQAACDAAKSEGYTIWVVAFGTSVTQNLKDCSSAERAYPATNTAELKAAFTFIASQVADLRLNQ